MAIIANAMFDRDPILNSVSMAWLGIIAYSLQIYFDFSGYSDMAIGLGRMFNVFDKHIDRDKKKILLNKNDYKITYRSLQRIFIKNDEDIAKVLPKGVIIPIWDWSFYIRGIDCSDLGKNITNEQFWEYAQTTFLNEVLLTVEEIWKETCKAENKVFDEEKQQLINFAKKTLIRKAVYMGLGAV